MTQSKHVDHSNFEAGIRRGFLSNLRESSIAVAVATITSAIGSLWPLSENFGVLSTFKSMGIKLYENADTILVIFAVGQIVIIIVSRILYYRSVYSRDKFRNISLKIQKSVDLALDKSPLNPAQGRHGRQPQ